MAKSIVYTVDLERWKELGYGERMVMEKGLNLILRVLINLMINYCRC
jgi:hypothetical protein